MGCQNEECLQHSNGECSLARHVEQQAKIGGNPVREKGKNLYWNKTAWDELVDRTKNAITNFQCENPSHVQEAINRAKPKFSKQIKKFKL